jgi:hypothetical protein
VAWANSRFGGEGAPSDSGYTKIYSTGSAFAAIKADGSVTTWGLFRHVGTLAHATIVPSALRAAKAP